MEVTSRALALIAGLAFSGCIFGTSEASMEGKCRVALEVGIGDIHNVSLPILKDLLVRKGCVPDLNLMTPTACREECPKMNYTSLDGTCNNLQYPLFGAVFTPLSLNLPPQAPPADLPSPRAVSKFLSSLPTTYHPTANAMVMQWGQFLTHDILKTTMRPNGTCSICSTDSHTCLQIPVPGNDVHAKKFGCNPEGPCCVKEAAVAKICGKHGFLNENTAFIDASNVYGSSEIDLKNWFREENECTLKGIKFKGETFMPGKLVNCSRPDSDHCSATFTAGDDRTNVFVGLGAMHNIFVREHNRVAKIFEKRNKNCWDADKVFYETRKIIGAMMQVITYEEWLPSLLGRPFESYTGYDKAIQPQVTVDVATAVLRVGHAMLDGDYPLVDGNLQEANRLSFLGTLKNAKTLLASSDEFVRGLLVRPSRNPVGVKEEITFDLFHNKDLAAINIQRGREFEIPGYRAWRKFCDLSDIPTFESMKDIVDKNVDLSELHGLYLTTDNIDLFTGLLIEKVKGKSTVGETTDCLTTKQFQTLRNGDRFWYENSHFNPRQIAALRRVTLAMVLCNNLHRLRKVPLDAFSLGAEFVECRRVPQLNLFPWYEC